MSQFQRFNVSEAMRRVSHLSEGDPVAISAISAICAPSDGRIAEIAEIADPALLSLRRTLQRESVTCVWSETLNEEIVGMCDEKLRSVAELKHPGMAIYSLQEIDRLLVIGCRSPLFASINAAKKILGAIVGECQNT